MKKIMFNDRYGLTQAVLEGKKTMTRRLMTMTLHKQNGKELTPIVPDDMFIASDGTAHFQVGRNGYMVPKQNQPAYHVGEEIAGSDSPTAHPSLKAPATNGWHSLQYVKDSEGWYINDFG